MTKQDFLFELGCEELPPKALPKLAASLHDSIKQSLDSLSLTFTDSEWFATPRRLAVRFTDLDTAQADKQVEKLGPAVQAAFDQEGNPKPAAVGFAKSNGVEVDQLTRKQTDKGERLAFIADVKGQATSELLQDVLEKAVNQLPVPKAMRWGDSSAQFTRPVHWILAILGEQILPVKLFELEASNQTFGHRFHAPEVITIRVAADYDSALNQAKVITSFAARKAKIREQVESIAQKLDATAVVDEELLEEVAALVEWPVALAGNFDKAFLDVPSEALISSMAEHQKYFHLVDANNNLLPKFITISNIESRNPHSVIEGNEKVIRPRLADAKFFYDTDSKKSLADYTEKLKTILFQNKLGTLFDKTQRVKALANSIAQMLNADVGLVSRAAELCKCDLMTDMVYEFPDLQGIMGRYYATNDGEPAEVAAAMDEVYMPRFAGDELPQTTTGLILAIAERIDTLVGIFGINQIPTGAKDPFALRRASLGVLRLITEKSLNLNLSELIDASISSYQDITLEENTKNQLLEFFAARELAMYQAMNIPTQAIQSVQALKITKPTDLAKRVDAVAQFNQSEESADLAEANKRVKNILEKSEFDPTAIQIDETLFESDEAALFSTIKENKDFVASSAANGEYQVALDKLAGLKSVVNNFFDNVMINAEDPKVRNNRLALITELRGLFLQIADISLLQK
ncbi:glycine--tRNA ligase subunit beta [Aliikangiella marina]|uniref:Glycine--tRNA ligase beta subunit n=1 Tax=Aliikangiella marina TaxID=1712262 RepID=A0A545T430_9GAMM|nr:glycine--tRNA ligase subunit beta [Aliikangiella marina]TQV71979.1 glycine--tRNA ligase subunit beta [Aliikangiella marina]TQV72032.1 glycine--tRNA ligase subunit beta [Aliikangiella marina]